MRGLGSRLTVLVGVALASLALAAAPASARTFAGTHDAVVGVSDPGDWIGGGGRYVWRGPDASIRASSSTPEALTVHVDGGPSAKDLHFELAAPAGTALAPGVHVGAERTPFRSAGRPGIAIGGDGRGCNTTGGRFEVRDIARDGAGELTRLWVVYEQRCENGDRAFWGEIRLGVPPASDHAVAPAITRWPDADPGSPRTVAPVTFAAGAEGAVLTRTFVGGTRAADFAVREDGCSGRVLAPGATCQLWVRFQPRAAGRSEATATLVDADGGRHHAALQGWSYGGVTEARVDGDPGDYIVGEHPVRATPATGSISVRGTRDRVTAAIGDDRGRQWSLDLAPPSGDILAAGTRYAPATRWPFHGGGAGLSFSGAGRGCNALTGEFTVDEARWRPDGVIAGLAVRFTQYCDGSGAAARGTLRFRAGDETPPAPWASASSSVTPMPVPGDEPPPASAAETSDGGPTGPPPPAADGGPAADGAGASDGGAAVAAGPPQGGSATTPQDGATALPDAPTGDRGSAPTNVPAGASSAPTGVAATAGAPRPQAVTPAAPQIRVLARRGRDLRYSVRFPRAGRLDVVPSVRLRGRDGRPRTLALGRARIRATGAGRRTVTVRVTRAAWRRLGRARSVTVTNRLTWTPRSGSPVLARPAHRMRLR